MNRTDIINYLIQKNNYNSYLEIGLDHGENFININCKLKESVDPYFDKNNSQGNFSYGDNIPEYIKKILTYRMTSDEFFAQNKNKYDIIFIDGHHTEEQVGKDIINALKVLNKNGKIVVHDCLPSKESDQSENYNMGTWNGTVWKGVAELIRQGIPINVVDADYGCGIVNYCDDKKLLVYPKKSCKTWDDFKANRNEMMNVISENEFKNIY